MVEKIFIKMIAAELKLNPLQVENTIELLDSDNTVPFIARYRKEKTGNLSEDQIRELARDRSADSSSYTASLAHPLNDKLQVSGDITLSTMSATPASGGIDATPDSGEDWSYSIQLMGSDLIKSGDIAIIGLHRDTNPSSDTTSLNLNTRYPVNQALRINPRLRLDDRRFSSDGSTQWTTAPSIRVNYMWRRDFNLELEAGGEWSNRKTAAITDKTSGYYISAGYRVDF